MGLRAADTDIRLALGRLVGSPLSDDDWRLASLGIASRGIGARSASEHAPAAHVASFAACRDLCCVIWPSFDPLDLDEGCRLGVTESALGDLIPPGTSVYAESDAPSQKSLSAKIEASSVSSLLLDPALTRARHFHLAAVRAPGLRLPWLPRTRISPRPYCGLPCGAAFVCPSGTATRPADFAGKCLTGGVITPFAAPGEATGFFVTTRSATLSAQPCQSSPPYLLSLKNPVSCFFPSPLTLVTPVPAWPRISSCPALPVAAPLTYGSPVESQASLRPGISRSHPSSAPPFSPSPTRLWPTFSMKLSPARTPSRTLPLRLPPWAPPFAWISTESRTTRGLASSTPSDISLRIAQRISCTLHRENARAILRRSPGPANDSFDLTGDLVSGSAW